MTINRGVLASEALPSLLRDENQWHCGTRERVALGGKTQPYRGAGCTTARRECRGLTVRSWQRSVRAPRRGARPCTRGAHAQARRFKSRGAIRSMYHEVFSAIRVTLAA